MSGGMRAFRQVSAKVKALKEGGTFSHLTGKELQRVAVLQIRMDVLRSREKHTSRFHEDWDRAEFVAIEWALGRLAMMPSASNAPPPLCTDNRWNCEYPKCGCKAVSPAARDTSQEKP